jgi:hypothetical protein
MKETQQMGVFQQPGSRRQKGGEIMGSVVKKRRKKMRKHKHKKQLDRDRHKKKK